MSQPAKAAETLGERLWREIVTAPQPLDREADGELSASGYRALHERARWASGLLVELLSAEDPGVAATFAILSGFAWTAAPAALLLRTNRKTASQSKNLEAVMAAICPTEKP